MGHALRDQGVPFGVRMAPILGEEQRLLRGELFELGLRVVDGQLQDLSRCVEDLAVFGGVAVALQRVAEQHHFCADAFGELFEGADVLGVVVEGDAVVVLFCFFYSYIVLYFP